MIRYLHRLREKRGFTMAELIIVIAIIAVLAAMVFPLFSNDDAKRDSAEIYASDFYASLQYCMTRYQKTDYHINTDMANAAADYASDPTKDPYIQYDKTKGQNVFVMPTGTTSYNIYIEVYYDRGIQYVNVGHSIQEIINDTSTVSDLAVEKLLAADLGGILNDAGTGYYYAVVNHDTSGFGNFKVLTTHYCDEALPAITDASTYKGENLMIVDSAELQCGIICGTCSSDRNTTGAYVGSLGTYFLNADDIELNPVLAYSPPAT